MRCPNCNTENPERSKFCSECGARISSAQAPAATADARKPVAGQPTQTRPQQAARPRDDGSGAFAAGAGMPPVGADAAPDATVPPTPPVSRGKTIRRVKATPSETTFGERRTVTVLFSDLKGFSTFSEKIDPEQATEMIDTLFKRFTTTITSHGGYFDKVIGDAIMAVFGVPEAHEDDPLRAVSCALEMVQVFRAWQEEWKVETGLRTGINTGEVIWQDVAGGGATVMGDTVNVAQRLESIATPGEILVSKNTHRLIENAFIMEELPEVQVKGRTEAVQPFRVVRKRHVEEEFSGAGFQTAMHGRTSEMEFLQRAFEETAKSRTLKSVLVTGNAGIGKSRLLFEFKNRLLSSPWPGAPQREVFVLRGRNAPYGGSPLMAIKEMVFGHFGIKQDMDAAECRRRFVAGALELWRGLERYSAIEKENFAHLAGMAMGLDFPQARVAALALRERIEGGFIALKLLFSELGRKGVVVLIVEDAQWADEMLLDLLDFFCRQETRSPIMLVVLARPEFLERPDTQDFWADPKRPGLQRIHVAPLFGNAVGSLAREALGMEPDKELSAFVVDQTGGNPYYVLQLLRYLLDEHLLRADARTNTVEIVSPDRTGIVPASLDSLLTARVDRLGDSVRETIKQAAVIGRTFWKGVLEHLIHRSVAEDLDELQRLELIVLRAASSMPGDSECVFSHALLRDAVYKGITLKERRILHAAVAVTVEQLALPDVSTRTTIPCDAPGPEASGRSCASFPIETAVMCAYHYEMAGNARRALLLIELAADSGIGSRGWKESVKYYTKALDMARSRVESKEGTLVIRRGDTRDQVVEDPHLLVFPRLLEKRGDAAYFGSSFRDSYTDYCEAMRLVESVDEAALAASKPDGGTGDDSIDHSPMPTPNIALWRARLARKIGSALQIIASATEAEIYYVRALELLPACAIHAEIAPAGTQQAEAVHVGPQGGGTPVPSPACPVCLERCTILSAFGLLKGDLQGNLDEGMRLAQQAHLLAVRIEAFDLAARAEMNMGTFLRMRGHYADAEQRFLRVLKYSESVRNLRHISAASCSLGILYRRKGELDKALQFYARDLSISEEIGDRRGVGATACNIGVVYRHKGEFDKALEYYQKDLAIAEETGDLRGQSVTHVNMGIIYDEKGEFDRAIESHQHSHSLALQVGDKPGQARAILNIAISRSRKGEPDQARADFQRVIELFKEIKDPNGLLNAYAGCGEALLALGRYDEAIELLRARLATASEELKDREETTVALSELGVAFMYKGGLDEAERYGRAAVAAGDDAAGPRTRATARIRLAEIILEKVETNRQLPAVPKLIAEALQKTDDAARLLGEDKRFDLDLAEVRVLKARAMLLRAGVSGVDVNHAVGLAQSALETGRRRHSQMLQLGALIALAYAGVIAGNREAAGEHLHEALAMARARKDVRAEAAVSRVARTLGVH
ncbi:MAG: tetratricopeptide repeat protein [Planctomycetota bacterium]|nr:tetratricopeptide repeat protein [Planctomycetota bacterium]